MMRSIIGCFIAASLPIVAYGEEPQLAVKAEAVAVPNEIAEGVRTALSKQAYTVSVKDGEARLTLWLRASVPAKANEVQIKNGLTYREIPEGTLMGAIKLAAAFVDFRKQEIPAGIYTLRLAAQPETGDHKDTAPHQDFLLMTRAEDDATEEIVEPKTLYKRSAKINDGDHPAVMLLFPSKVKVGEATIAKKADGVSVFETRVTLDADGTPTSIGIALAVAGYSKTR